MGDTGGDTDDRELRGDKDGCDRPGDGVFIVLSLPFSNLK